MSSYSFEDFIISQIHHSLNQNKFIYSSWERVVEKSSSWMCYVYTYDKIFIGRLYMHFFNNEDNKKLVPYDLICEFKTKYQRQINRWTELYENDIYKYTQNFNLDEIDGLKTVCQQLIPLLILSRKSGILSFFDGSMFAK